MLVAGLGRGVQVAHLRQRLGRRVVIGHALEQRTSEFAHRLLRHLRQFLAVAEHDEAANAALEIRLGVPGDLRALVTLGRHAARWLEPAAAWCRRRRRS